MQTIAFLRLMAGERSFKMEGPAGTGLVELGDGGVWRLHIDCHDTVNVAMDGVLERFAPVPIETTSQNSLTVLSHADKTWDLRLDSSGDSFSFGFGPMRGHFTLMEGESPVLTPRVGERQAKRLPTKGLRISLSDVPSRRYYAMGERTGFLDKKGRIWENWTTDCTHLHAEMDPLYQAHPFLIGIEDKRAFGVYLHDSRRSVFDLAHTHEDESTITVEGRSLEIYLIPGPTPGEVIRRYTDLVGRASLPPLWAFGYHQCRWSYTSAEEVAAVADNFRARKIPLEAMWLDIDYMQDYKVFTFDADRFKEPEKLVASLKDKGVRTVTIVDPGVKKEADYWVYEAGRKLDGYIKTAEGDEYEGEVWPIPAVWPDFSRKDVRDWWGLCHGVLTEIGIDGIWNDMNEPANLGRLDKTLPKDTLQAKGEHALYHNLYGLGMAMATHAGLRHAAPDKRPFILTRSGFPGIQKFAWTWTGDNTSCWEHLEMSLPMLVNLGLSGQPFVGCDIGGFYFDCDAELLIRWTWLGAFYPFMRNHASKGSARQEPWTFGPEVETCIRHAIELRYAMLPYLYTLAREATLSGQPLLRPLFYADIEDETSLSIHDQVFLGDALILAPALRPGQRQRAVYLPKGDWMDFFTATRLEGERWHLVATPLDGLPVFQRLGSAIPMTQVAQHTTSAEWPVIDWRVTLGHHISGEVYFDAGDGPTMGRVVYLEGTMEHGVMTLVLKGELLRTKHTIEILGVERPAKANGLYSYDAKTRRLVASFVEDRLELKWR